MRRWCSLAKPLLLGLTDQGGLKQHPMAVFGAGTLLSWLSNCLECWAALAADEAAEAAVKQQIALHTADLVPVLSCPVLARVMATTAVTASRNTAERRRKAKKPETAQDAAEAAHAQAYFPHHSDIVMAVHLLCLWKGLAGNWPGQLLRTSSSSTGQMGSSSSSSRGGGGSSTSLQETVLPACNLAVSLLKTWPPNPSGSAASSSRSSSSDSSDVPDGEILRLTVTTLMYIISHQLLVVIRNELLHSDSPLSAADAKFASQLSASTAVQHLLLLQMGFVCHLLHKQQRGLSPLKAKEAAAAVTGSRELAAAAVAAEAAAVRGSSKQQQYLSVLAHHAAALELLLVPADGLNIDLNDSMGSASQFHIALGTVAEFLLNIYHVNQAAVPVELCAALHCMLAEAAALAPDWLLGLHLTLVSMNTLQDVYFGAKMGPQVATAAITAALGGYTGALAASLQLLGPAVLHAYKHGTDGDTELKPGDSGCPLGNDGRPLKGGPLRDAALNLFRTIIVKMGSTPAIKDVLTAAFQQRPLSTAAVCETAIRGAARHNMMPSALIRAFALLAMNTCYEVAAPPGGSTCSSPMAAAVSDSSKCSIRSALLLQCGLITTQVKYASSSCGGAEFFSALFHHLMPTAHAVVRLGKVVERTVGGSSSAEQQSVRVQTMLPWIALCGHCLFFAGGQLLLVMEDQAAVRGPGLDDRVLNETQQVLASIMAVLLMVDFKVNHLQQLQPEGTCVLQGPADTASKALHELEGKLAAVAQDFEGVLNRWNVAAGMMAQKVAANRQGSDNIAWGHELQNLLRTTVGMQGAAALQDAGAAVCADFPLQLCCNNPGCTSMGMVREMQLGSSCSGCKVARYCSKACQGVAWKMGHNKVCKRITKAAAAAGDAQ